MGAFGVVELQGAGDGVEDGRGDAGERAAFELGVVLDADPGQGRDLTAAQPGHPPGADTGQTRLLRGDLGSSRDQELADLGTVVHIIDVTTGSAGVGMPCQYTSSTGTPPSAPGSGSLEAPSSGPRPPARAINQLTRGDPPMRGVVMYGPGDVRVEDRPEPTILKPTDAIIRLSATCICGSDLWPYRGADALDRAVADGPRVRRHRRGGRLGGHHDQAGPVRRRVVLRLRQHLRDLPGRLPDLLHPPRGPRRAGGAQAQRMRVPLADGTLVATPEVPDAETWSRTSWPPPTCSAPAGSPPSPPRSAQARPSPSSVTARSGCSGCWPPSSSAPSGSSR